MTTCTSIEDLFQQVFCEGFGFEALVVVYDMYSLIEDHLLRHHYICWCVVAHIVGFHLLEPLLAYFHSYLFEGASHTSWCIVTYLEALPHHVESCGKFEELPSWIDHTCHPWREYPRFWCHLFMVYCISWGVLHPLHIFWGCTIIVSILEDELVINAMESRTKHLWREHSTFFFTYPKRTPFEALMVGHLMVMHMDPHILVHILRLPYLEGLL